MTMAGVIIIAGAFLLFEEYWNALFIFGTGAILLTAFELFDVRGKAAIFFKLMTVTIIIVDFIAYHMLDWEKGGKHWVNIIGIVVLTLLFIVWASLQPDEED